MAQPCYIAGYDNNNFPYDVIRQIEDLANDCLEGTGLYIPSTAQARYSSVSDDSVVIANDGKISVFYPLKASRDKIKSLNTIYWDNNQWVFHINDDLSADDLISYGEAIDRFNATFNGITF